jgi:electron transport complex protein RnfE
MEFLRQIKNGVFKENPTFVIMLGICPTLATTTTVKNAFFMALAATAVLICSNGIIALVRRRFPKEIRIPCFIVVIASFVTMVDLMMNAFAPEAVVKALGIFIPLIVVNCIILGRAEAYAAKNGVLNSIGDGIGIGGGFMLSLLTISTIREIIGSGSWWETPITTAFSGDKAALVKPVSVLTLAPGAFLLLGTMFAFFKWRRARKEAKMGVEMVAAAVPWEVGPEKKKDTAQGAPGE